MPSGRIKGSTNSVPDKRKGKPRLKVEERVGDEGDEWMKSNLSSGKYALINRTRRRESEKRRANANKIKAIDYLGGCCVDCGAAYADVDRITHLGGVTFIPAEAFDIDHVLWEKKTIRFGDTMKRNFEKWIKPEIDNCKCELVCKICHVIRTTVMKRTDNDYKAMLKTSAKKGWVNQYTSAKEST